MQKAVPHFLTHNDAIAGFTSQSLGLPAYACKTGSSTAINQPPECTKTCHSELQNLKKNMEKGQSPPPVGREHPLSIPYLLGASFPALAMIRPHCFKPWIHPCHQEVCKVLQSSCLSVCISRSTCPNAHNFLYMLHVAVARFCSGGTEIRYVLPVLWTTSCFHVVR